MLWFRLTLGLTRSQLFTTGSQVLPTTIQAEPRRIYLLLRVTFNQSYSLTNCTKPQDELCDDDDTTCVCARHIFTFYTPLLFFFPPQLIFQSLSLSLFLLGSHCTNTHTESPQCEWRWRRQVKIFVCRRDFYFSVKLSYILYGKTYLKSKRTHNCDWHTQKRMSLHKEDMRSARLFALLGNCLFFERWLWLSLHVDF